MIFDEEYETLCKYDQLEMGKKKEYLHDGKKHFCRFCMKTDEQTKFDKSAHAISEMIGNKWLFSYRECKHCNTLFGNTCEDSFGKYVLPFKIVSQVFGKKRSLGYSIDNKGQIKINKEDAVIPEFDNNVKALIKETKDSDILTLTESGFKLKLRRKSYTPEWVYFTLLKMALTVLPMDFIKDYAYTFASLKVVVEDNEDRKNIFEKFVTIGYEEFIPGFSNGKVSVELFKRKKDNIQIPFMYFCLNFGNYSLQIPLPSDSQRNGQQMSLVSCRHTNNSECRVLNFHDFEKEFECYFMADRVELSEEQLSKLKQCM